MPSNHPAKIRDPRLDFFRGIGMLIIFTAHTPGNWLTNWIPARWGWSDATEIFVFCSGFASALAFGRVFRDRGWWMGTLRIAHRCWQVYWCHIGLFFAVAAAMYWLQIASPRVGDGFNYVTYIGGIGQFFGNVGPYLLGLFSLHWVPNYFDILPMYLVILALVPVVVLAHGVGSAVGGRWGGLAVVAALSVGMWAAAQFDDTGSIINGGLDPEQRRQWWLALHAEPPLGWFESPPDRAAGERTWFFNPFGWQLVFFTGFAFGAGWMPKVPMRLGLALAATALLIALIPFGGQWMLRNYLTSDFSFAADWAAGHYFNAIFSPFKILGPAVDWHHESIGWIRGKTQFGIGRYVHFLLLAYVAVYWAGKGGERLLRPGWWRPAVGVLQTVGTQSLAVFLMGMWLARMAGAMMDHWGDWSDPATLGDRTYLSVTVANVGGWAVLIATAYFVGWIKTQPWRRPRPDRTLAAAQPAAA